MSFILNDKQLRDLLVSLGAKDISKFAQSKDPKTLINVEAYSLANKLLQDLQSQLSPGTLSNVGTTNPNKFGADFSIKNARNIGDFVNWIADNKLTWNGKPFAWKANESNIAPKDAWVFSAYTAVRDRDAASQLKTDVAYASKNELVQFIMALRDTEENKNNPVMQAAIGALIDQINKAVPGTIDSKTPAVVQFKDDTVVDGFNGNVLYTNNPYLGLSGNEAPLFEGSNTKLTYANIKSPSALQDWLNNIRIDQYGVLDQKGNVCEAFHILFLRARYLSERAVGYEKQVPGYAQLAKKYMDTVVQLGQTFHGPDGKACPVTTSSTIVDGGTKPGTDGSTGAGGAAGTDAAAATGNLMRILTEAFLPFQRDIIDCNRFERFLKYLESANLGLSSEHISAAREYIRQISNLARDNTKIFNIGGGYDTFVIQMRNANTVASAAQESLTPLITSINSILQDIESKYTQIAQLPKISELLYGQHQLYEMHVRNLGMIRAAAIKAGKGQ